MALVIGVQADDAIGSCFYLVIYNLVQFKWKIKTIPAHFNEKEEKNWRVWFIIDIIDSGKGGYLISYFILTKSVRSTE